MAGVTEADSLRPRRGSNSYPVCTTYRNRMAAVSTIILWTVNLEIQNGVRYDEMVQSDQTLGFIQPRAVARMCLSILGSRARWTEHAQ